MKNIKYLAIVFIASLLLNGILFSYPLNDDTDSAAASVKKLRMYTTTRLTTNPPQIDGVLDDDCWATGEWTGDFIQWIPKEGGKPTFPTELKILYDNRNLYVAIRAYDYEPDKIIRKAGRRDDLVGDAVGINFDSYHDHRTGFEFNVTAAGQKVDLMLTNPMNADFNWNAVWYVKTGMEDSAWVAEYEIPLSQLRYSSDDEQVWGMHCWRWIDRLLEESDWEPQVSNGPGMLYLFGELRGIKGLPASRRIEIMPYTLGKLKTFKQEPANPFASDGRDWLGNMGIDAKIGLSSNFTADLSINPDFGQVESDPSVMNLSAYETFYEEKRPFFLEGKNIFTFDFDGSNLFYSRRIGHSPSYSPGLIDNQYMDYPDQTTILSAVKLSGKTSNGLAVGVLQSLTANQKARLNTAGSESNVSVEPLTNYSIIRLQQDFKEGNTVLGGILTSTNRFINDSHLEYLNRNAYTGGIDFLHHWNDKEFYVEGKFVGSFINGSRDAMQILQNSSARYYQRPDAAYVTLDSTRTNLSGYGGKIIVGKKSKGFWRYSTEVDWRSPGLDLNDIGYMPSADNIKQSNSITYFVSQPVSIFRSYSITLNEWNNWDFGGNYLSSAAYLSVNTEFLNKWALNASLEYYSDELNNTILRGGRAMKLPGSWYASTYMRTDPSEKILFDLSLRGSLSGANHCRNYNIHPGISLMPSNTLKFSLGLDFFLHDDKLMYIYATQNNSNIILAKIMQRNLSATFRVDYNITPEFSIQYYGSPFASVGKYSEFKDVNNPAADNYEDRFTRLQPILNGNNYDILENNNGVIDYSFGNPDFNFSQFRSNLVIRWEYRPGSQVYLVWSNEMTYSDNPGQVDVYKAMKNLNHVYPNNIFLLKFNYWFSL